jgi:hypothetical protein
VYLLINFALLITLPIAVRSAVYSRLGIRRLDNAVSFDSVSFAYVLNISTCILNISIKSTVI